MGCDFSSASQFMSFVPESDLAMASLLWGSVLFVLCFGHAQSDSELILGQLQQLTEAISKQKAEFSLSFAELEKGIKEEIGGMIDEAKTEWHSMSNATRKDVATLQHLLGTDECIDFSHNCSADAICIDDPISYRCNCKPGFTGDGFVCKDINECKDKYRCGPYKKCINTPGRYKCLCGSGFNAVNDTCEDVDECNEGKNRCDRHANCQNTIGSYTCACSMFYQGNGFKCRESDSLAACKDPFKAVLGVGCIHIITMSQTFARSRKSCEKLGGDLFVADNAEHYLRLAQHFLDTRQKNKERYLYVGVKDDVWLSGRNVTPAEQAPRYPSRSSGSCSYTDGDTSEKFLLWRDPCSNRWPALCEKR